MEETNCMHSVLSGMEAWTLVISFCIQPLPRSCRPHNPPCLRALTTLLSLLSPEPSACHLYVTPYAAWDIGSILSSAFMRLGTCLPTSLRFWVSCVTGKP